MIYGRPRLLFWSSKSNLIQNLFLCVLVVVVVVVAAAVVIIIIIILVEVSVLVMGPYNVMNQGISIMHDSNIINGPYVMN